MLAIDTNIVVRFLANDHPMQSEQARRLIADNDVFVGDTVWLECEWVLRSVYKFDVRTICRILRQFAGLPRVSVENADRLERSLQDAEAGMDFADALHLARAHECRAFATFDAKLIEAASGSASGVPVRSA